MTLFHSDIRHAVIRAGLSGRITVINGIPVVWRGAWRHNRHTTRCRNHAYGCEWYQGPIVAYTGAISHGICPSCQSVAKMALEMWRENRSS